MNCLKCGVYIPEGETVCGRCMAPEHTAPVVVGELDDLYHEIEVFRTHKEYQKAYTTCLKIMRITPNDARIYAQMGDLCLDRDLPHDAAKNYLMAKQLEGQNVSYAAKYDAIVEKIEAMTARSKARTKKRVSGDFAFDTGLLIKIFVWMGVVLVVIVVGKVLLTPVPKQTNGKPASLMDSIKQSFSSRSHFVKTHDDTVAKPAATATPASVSHATTTPTAPAPAPTPAKPAQPAAVTAPVDEAPAAPAKPSGPPVTIKSYAGKSSADVIKDCGKLGFQVSETDTPTNQMPPGTVIRTDPAAGTRLSPGEHIEIIVATAPPSTE